MRRRAALFILMLYACYARPDTLGAPCVEDPDCDEEQVCEAQLCIVEVVESTGEPPCPDTDSDTDTDTDGGTATDTDTDDGSGAGACSEPGTTGASATDTDTDTGTGTDTDGM
jgi:hypothetical protein